MEKFNNFIAAVTDTVIDPIIALLFVVALALFLWGVVQFILNASSDKDREDGKWRMVWGIVGMFIMASVKGIISIIEGTLGL